MFIYSHFYLSFSPRSLKHLKHGIVKFGKYAPQKHTGCFHGTLKGRQKYNWMDLCCNILTLAQWQRMPSPLRYLPYVTSNGRRQHRMVSSVAPNDWEVSSYSPKSYFNASSRGVSLEQRSNLRGVFNPFTNFLLEFSHHASPHLSGLQLHVLLHKHAFGAAGGGQQGEVGRGDMGQLGEGEQQQYILKRRPTSFQALFLKAKQNMALHNKDIKQHLNIPNTLKTPPEIIITSSTTSGWGTFSTQVSFHYWATFQEEHGSDWRDQRQKWVGQQMWILQ